MLRREFITLAATWPLAAGAQQALPVIGFLHEGLPAPPHLTAAFTHGLLDARINEGRGVTIENRWAEGQYDRLPALAADLIEHRVEVIAAAYLVAASGEGRNSDSAHRFRYRQRSGCSGPRI